jgi:hypothetical protein
LVGELGVYVHDVVDERLSEQRAAQKDVVERLRVALEHVAVALVLGERVDEIVEDVLLQDRDRVRELEVVQVAGHIGAADALETVTRSGRAATRATRPASRRLRRDLTKDTVISPRF